MAKGPLAYRHSGAYFHKPRALRSSSSTRTSKKLARGREASACLVARSSLSAPCTLGLILLQISQFSLSFSLLLSFSLILPENTQRKEKRGYRERRCSSCTLTLLGEVRRKLLKRYGLHVYAHFTFCLTTPKFRKESCKISTIVQV